MPGTSTQVDVQADVRVSVDSLRQYGVEAFTKAGLPEEGAREVTEVQLESNLRNQPTHNMGNVPGYARAMQGGRINTKAQIKPLRESPVHVQLDGDNGPGQWVSVVAMRHAIAKAKQSGIGVCGAIHSNHFGAAGHYAWMAAEAGMIGLCTTNGGLVLAPWGGVTPTFGNNPLGVGIPAGKHAPVVLDIAMSVVAQGKIALAIAEGKPIPMGWLMDKRGRISTNPDDFSEGIGVPIAEHKGYGLTLVMEVLAGVLTGAGFTRDHAREVTRDESRSPDLGHFFLAINPEMFMAVDEFKARVDRMIDDIKGSELAEGSRGIMVAGEPEMLARAENLKSGSVPLLPSTLKGLQKYGADAKLETQLRDMVVH